MTAEYSGLADPGREAVDSARVELLYRRAPTGFAVTLAVGAIVVAALVAGMAAWTLALWAGALAAVIAGRHMLTRRYCALGDAARTAPGKWERRFVVGSAATSSLWGALALLPLPSYTLQLFVALVIGGMVLGAMSVVSSSRPAFRWFAVPALGAQVADFVLLGGDIYPWIGLIVLVFLVASLRVFESLHRPVIQNIERGIENERLRAEQRVLFDAATVAMAFIRARRVVDCNAALERLFGYSRRELIGAESGLWFFDAETWEEVARESAAAAREHRSFRRELELRRADGTRVWVDMSSRALIPGDPSQGLIVVYADVSERRDAEMALRASEARLDLALRASQSGIWDHDVAAGITHFSPRFKEIVGYPPEADFGELFFFADRLHPDDRARLLAARDRALAEAAAFDEEYRLRCADGSYVWVHGRGLAVRDAAGQPSRFVGSIIDISDRKAVEERLRESEQHFRHLVETANDLVWAVDAAGRWTYLSPRATRQIFACEPEDLIGQRLVETQPEAERERTSAMLARVLADGSASHFETVHTNRRGERVTLTLNATAQRGADGSIVGVTGTATDISAIRANESKLAAALAEQRLIFDSASDGIVMVRNRAVYRCNSKFAAMLGYEPDELVGKPTLIWYAHPGEWEHVGAAARSAMSAGQVYEGELLAKRRNGESFWCETRGRAIDPSRIEEGSIWVYVDISARKAREQRIRHLAEHDALTGLLNRRLLEDRLAQALSLARRNGALVAVMLIDLDGFKAVNDGFGHLVGDYVLRAVAKRIKDCVRESDTVARLGGDEFVVVLVGQRSEEDSAVVAEKILAALSEPVGAGGRSFGIGASIGISLFPRDGATAEALIKQADTAMYRVKEAGKNRFQYYS